jgi:hypothetical protein
MAKKSVEPPKVLSAAAGNSCFTEATERVYEIAHGAAYDVVIGI